MVRLPEAVGPLEQARNLALALVSERGEASGAALARDLLTCYRGLSPDLRAGFHDFLASGFLPEPQALKLAAEAYLADPGAETAARLTQAAEPPRQELLRRLNSAPGATGALISMRCDLLREIKTAPRLKPLEADLKHLLASWFNRGFLELRRIDWGTSAIVLEKLIAYEAVHAINGWDDLRRRLASDRRCFGFFHPALSDEPLIFVEVALVNGTASAIAPLLAPLEGPAVPAEVEQADTAIFYSISNCQEGLRGISFGNFLIKQVVEELRHEAPQIVHFATLSPVPGFRAWLDRRLAQGSPNLLRADERAAIRAVTGRAGAKGAFKTVLGSPAWIEQPAAAGAVRPILSRLCAEYLTARNDGKGPVDPVARFHLGNGARLERINWLANVAPRGLKESYGLMVNYLYDPDLIEANHEAFVRKGIVAHSETVARLMTERPATKPPGLMIALKERVQRVRA